MAATMCRVKVVVGKEKPFWMLIDFDECPRVRDVEEKISHTKGVPVQSLLVDNCVLLSDEKSLIFRDNDEVCVNIQGSQENVLLDRDSVSCEKASKKKKRKHKEIDSDNDRNTVSSHLCFSGTDAAPGPPQDNGQDVRVKESEKSKHHKRRKTEEKGEAEYRPDIDRPGGHPQSIHTKQEQSSTDLHQQDSSACSQGKIHSKNQETLHSPTDYKDKETDVADATCADLNDSSLIALDNVINSSTPSSAKKKRRRKRTKKDKETPTETETQPRSPEWVMPTVPPELRLPKWQQPKSKKTVFSSSDEEDKLATAEENGTATKLNGSATELQISTPTAPDSGTCPADVYKNSNNLFASGPKAVDTEHEFENVSNGCEISVTRDSIRASDWNANQQERNTPSNYFHPPQPAAVVPVNPTDQQEARASGLAEFLRMSPEERGVTLPPFMKAERLPNGAMLYNRGCLPKAGCGVQGQSHSHKASYHQFSKQQQLATVATNKSIIIQNPVSNRGRGTQDTSAPVASKTKSGQTSREAKTTSTIPVEAILEPLYLDYSKFPDLTSPPSAGDRIAYKVLELGEDYTPGESDYKEAEVMQYDDRNKALTVKLLSTGGQKKKKPGRFDLPDESTEGEEEIHPPRSCVEGAVRRRGLKTWPKRIDEVRKIMTFLKQKN